MRIYRIKRAIMGRIDDGFGDWRVENSNSFDYDFLLSEEDINGWWRIWLDHHLTRSGFCHHFISMIMTIMGDDGWILKGVQFGVLVMEEYSHTRWWWINLFAFWCFFAAWNLSAPWCYLMFRVPLKCAIVGWSTHCLLYMITWLLSNAQFDTFLSVGVKPSRLPHSFYKAAREWILLSVAPLSSYLPRHLYVPLFERNWGFC